MKTLFFDCSSGISGNMAMGALLELVGDEDFLLNELKKLNVDGYKIEITKKIKNGIAATHVNVIVDGRNEYGHEHHEEHNHKHHGHEHHHPHRNLRDVNEIIDVSSLDKGTKELAKRIFLKVAQAESKVHNRPLEEVHFHEVGAIDSIIDIVGCAILISRIKPDRILSGVVNEGHGFIECAHGKMSVPVPATTEIFASGKVKFRQIDIDTELVTPTGAAILAELAQGYGMMPEMTLERIGWGAGTKDLEIPNVLKICLGETIEPDEKHCPQNEEEPNDEVAVLETNIDDCTGEILGYTMEKLFEGGALDVFFTPIYMKKNRPAYRLTVICLKEDMQRLQQILFRETTTIGLRYRYERRAVLSRETVEIETEYGTVKGKKAGGYGGEYLYPEYESLRELAEKSHIPLKELYGQLAGKK